jgi:hypothetical protein
MMNQGSLERKNNDCQGKNDGGTNTRTNSRGRSGTSRTQKSRSPVRQSNDSRSPMRQNRQGSNNKLKSPKINHEKNRSRSPNRMHYNNKSRSPMRMRKKNPAAMTVIVNRCDLWDSAAHFQPDECFQPQIQLSAARALPYRFESDQVIQPSPPPGIEKQEEAKFMSVTTARVPHHVESIQFPIITNDGRPEGRHRCDVIDTTIPNPHDPNVVHDKYWAQRR